MKNTLSTKEQQFIKRMMSAYQEKETTGLDELKLLDKKVKRTPRIFAYTFGTISSLILGFGMSVSMGVILKDLMVLGVIIGVIGLLFVSINYPDYKKMKEKNINQYRDEIISISDSLLNEEIND